MCEKLYEIHIISRGKCPEFYVIDRKTNRRFDNWDWPPEFKQLGCEYVNEHSDFIVEQGYVFKYVKCYFVDTNILGNMRVYVELTEEGERREIADYHNRILQISIGGDTTGDSVYPTFYHPKKK